MNIMKFIKSIFNSPFLYFYLWRLVAFKGRSDKNLKREKDLSDKGAYTQKTLLIFGDSQVAFWDMLTHFGLLSIKNRGIDGDCASCAVTRFEEDIKFLKPSAVLILIGTNDIAKGCKIEDIAFDIKKMAQFAVGHGVYVFVSSVLPTSGFYTKGRSLEKISLLNKLLQEEAKNLNMSYVDFWRPLANERGNFKKSFTYDGLHPNKAGYAIMSRIVLIICRVFIGKEV